MAKQAQAIPKGYRARHPEPDRGGGTRAIDFYKKALGAEGSGGSRARRVDRTRSSRSATRSSLADEMPDQGARGQHFAEEPPSPSSCSAKTWTRPGSGRRRGQGNHAARGPVLGDRTGCLEDPFGTTGGWLSVQDLTGGAQRRRTSSSRTRKSGD
jgi:hypothetical protein